MKQARYLIYIYLINICNKIKSVKIINKHTCIYIYKYTNEWTNNE